MTSETEKMIEVALEYWSLGCNITVIGPEKQCDLVRWRKWITQRQTAEEFRALPWDKAEGFAIVCGTQLTDGYYLGAIDADIKNVTQETIDKGKEFQENLKPYTQTEGSPSGGRHYVYLSRLPIKSVNTPAVHDFCGCEVKGANTICIMAPSKGYKRLNDNSPTQVESLNDLFDNALRIIGFKVRTQKNDVEKLLKGVKEGERDRSAIIIATYYRKTHLTKEEALEKLIEWNTQNQPPLPPEAISKTVESAYKTEEPYNYKYKGIDDSFNPVQFAKELMQEYHFRTLKDTEDVYVFNEATGIYEPTGETTIKENMVKKLDEATRHRYFQDIVFYIQGASYIERPHNPFNSIAVENGILDISTREITPFNPEYFITSRLNITFNKEAQCPKIQKFLTEVVGESQVNIIQELIGYTLYKAMPYHKAFMFVGDGANGKSTLLELIKTFLGIENVSNATLQALCYNRFSIAQVYNKMANICADLPSTALTQTGTFKMLTGGDTLNGEEKFKPPFSFKPYAKLMFSTNQVPETKDDTTAFFRRWILIICNNVFTGEKCNPHILEEITTPEELSGLLNWALEGLDRVLKNGGFSTTENLEELRKQYIRKSNSAKAFIEECLRFNTGAFVTKEKLFSSYLFFCQKNNLSPMQKRGLTTNMQLYFANTKDTQRRSEDGKRIEGWVNVEDVTAVTSPLFRNLGEDNESEKSLTKQEQGNLNNPEVTEVTPTNSEIDSSVEAKVCERCHKEIPPATNYRVTITGVVCRQCAERDFNED